jgi:hypothetical protein
MECSCIFGKFQLISTDSQANVNTPDGTNITAKQNMEYLGTTLQGDGRADNELSRRIGMAKADFGVLAKTWSR